MTPVDLTTLRVLVADDNAHMRRLIRILLNGFGVREVFEAEDGASALEVHAANSIDVVILDWAMPIMDGIEVTRMIRGQGDRDGCFVPIIMVSGHALKRRVIEARDAGVTEFICKPLSARVLYDRIANCILRPREFVRSKSYFGPDRRRFENPQFSGDERRGTGTDS